MTLILTILTLFILISVLFVLVLVRFDRGEKEPRSALWSAFGMGVLAVALAIGLEVYFVHEMTTGTLYNLRQVSVSSLKVAVIEELAKCLPLAIFIYRKKYFNEHTDGVMYFAIAGLAFGLVENILYTLQFGAEVGVARLILTPLFHAATTGLIGSALIKVKLDRTSPFRFLATLLAVILLHALYDFGVLSGLPIFIAGSVLLTFGLGVALFMTMYAARRADERVEYFRRKLLRSRAAKLGHRRRLERQAATE